MDDGPRVPDWVWARHVCSIALRVRVSRVIRARRVQLWHLQTYGKAIITTHRLIDVDCPNVGYTPRSARCATRPFGREIPRPAGTAYPE